MVPPGQIYQVNQAVGEYKAQHHCHFAATLPQRLPGSEAHLESTERQVDCTEIHRHGLLLRALQTTHHDLAADHAGLLVPRSQEAVSPLEPAETQ